MVTVVALVGERGAAEKEEARRRKKEGNRGRSGR